MDYLVEVGSGSQGYYGWEDYKGLKRLCDYFDSQCSLYEDTEGEEGLDLSDYQTDSPYAEFITGYNTDSFADTSVELITNHWEEYVDICEEEDKNPDWDYFWDNIVWECPDYQLCHTWLRVTNIHTESDIEVKAFAKESDYCTMKDILGLPE